MAYSIQFEKRAAKELSKLEKPVQKKIINAIQVLSETPKPVGSKKLTNTEDWRIRIGNYRVIYRVEDEQLLILVIKVGHRKDVYRK